MAEEKDDYSYDTDAMRDVASTDMGAIAEDIEESRSLFGGLGSSPSAAFSGHRGFLGLGTSPFEALLEKWNQAANATTDGMATSQERVEEAAEALTQTADDYDGVDTQSATDFTRILYNFRQN